MPISDERIDAAARAIAKVEGWDLSAVEDCLVDMHHNPRVVRWVDLATAAIKARPPRRSSVTQ